jgi:hypothetical protein
MLAKLGYPGFSYLRTHARNKNPSEVLLTPLAQKSLDARVSEALPRVALKYRQPNPWLVGDRPEAQPSEQARICRYAGAAAS